MPRKRTTGRARAVTGTSRVQLELERVNRKLNTLAKSGQYGSYASKRLINVLSEDERVVIKKSRRGRRQVIIQGVKVLSQNQSRYYAKTLREFRTAKTSTPLGIKETRRKAEEKLKQSLGNITNKTITTKDVDDFYSIVSDADYKKIVEKIPPSEFYVIVTAARKNKYNAEQFTDLLSSYVTDTDEDLRVIAKRLFNKFVVG